MRKTDEAVIVVDYQNDFANPETGSLYVNSWEKITKPINEIVSETKSKGWIILTSRELHPAGHISFASNYINKEPIVEAFKRGENPTEKNFITLKEVESWTKENNGIADKAEFSIEELKAYLSVQENQMDAVWPDHCVENTFWAEFYKDFDTSQIDIEIKKGFQANSHPYSAFGGRTLDETRTTLEIIQEYGVKLVKIVGLATDYCDIATAMDAKKYGFNVEFIKKASAWVDPAGTIEALKQMRENGIKIIDEEQDNDEHDYTTINPFFC